MTQQQFDELKSLISRNFEMIGRIYEEHGGRLTRREVVQEQFSHDLHAVAEGVTGNAERLDRFEGRVDGLEANLDHLSAAVTASYTHHDQRLRALEN